MRKSIVLICVYFGEFPYYFSLFKKSAKYNKDINWIIFTDVEETHEEGNIKFINFNLGMFNKLATEKMNLNINLSNSYKLCDFKLAYGKIFEDYVADYDFCGHCDLDVIWGDIRKFIPNELMYRNDLITTDSRYISGVFSIYKNKERFKNIYKNLNDDYEKLIHSEDYEGLDEVSFDIVLKKYPKLRIFNGHKCGGGTICLQRYGKNRTPARWDNGKVIVESYLKDYPGQKSFCGFGAETMLFHIREKLHWHYVDLETGYIDTYKKASNKGMDLFFKLKELKDFNLSTDATYTGDFPAQFSPANAEKMDKLLLIHTAVGGRHMCHRNYFHWTTEVMPHLLNAIEQARDERCKIAFYTIGKTVKSLYFLKEKDYGVKHIKQFIESIGIEDRILPLEEGHNYKIKEILIYENFRYVGGKIWSANEKIKSIRDFVLSKLPKDFLKYKRIYAARNITSTSWRTVSEEAESIILSKGFKKLHMEDYSVFEQAAMFNYADVIVSPHGAQLANLIYCKDGAKIIEISNGYNYKCFPRLAEKTVDVNINYTYAPEEGIVFEGSDTKFKKNKGEKIYPCLKKIEELLNDCDILKV